MSNTLNYLIDCLVLIQHFGKNFNSFRHFNYWTRSQIERAKGQGKRYNKKYNGNLPLYHFTSGHCLGNLLKKILKNQNRFYDLDSCESTIIYFI